MIDAPSPTADRIADRVLPDGTVLRPLVEREELEACLELQRRVWGEGFADVASPAVLKIVQEVGGVSAGAFSPEGRLLGFVFGVTGIRRGRPLHWSHMLAVDPEARGRDLGFHLKAYQRELLLPLGVAVVRWTYDPLVAKNAYLNLVRLGARPVRYLRDYYGSGADSALSEGIGTDRFVVDWAIREPQVARLLADDAEPARGARPTDGEPEAPTANVREAGPPGAPGEPVVTDPPAAPALRVEIPSDIQEVRQRSPEAASLWRASTRRALEALLDRGYRVDGFEREPASTGGGWRCFYLLTEGR